MAQNFLPCDRDQELLLPPSLRDWLPREHLAWFVLDAVAEMDLSAFYAGYREDGWGRAAHDPQMMVALALYAYAVGERSSRGIERRCVEDVAFRVIAANQVPDHATIARFRVRHEEALGGLFGEVLGLCGRAGLVSVGVVALDSTKVHANASGQANRGYDQIAREILAEAAEVDAREDERFGERRGDELPPELADTRARRAWLREAKHELEREWAAAPAQPGEGNSRAARLDAAKRRLEDEWQLERHAEKALAAGRERRQRELAEQGRRARGRPPASVPTPPPAPTGRVNLTDPDSRPVKTHRGFIQGYNAQAVATGEQIVIAAEVKVGSPDGGQLEPMLAAARGELVAAGVAEKPDVLLADAGYWSKSQIEQIRAEGIRVLVPPDGHARGGPPTEGKRGGPYRQMRSALASEEGSKLYRRRQQIIEPVFAQTKVTRRADRFQRRGIAACRSEWRLISATHNLLKLWRHGLSAQAAA